ncbi:MAG: PD-(D/E)XK nuclease family transposase [Treponema sp.]|nr:PD-(D/E)XK nuclease family transposase [Treponema sp.]
MTIVFSGDNKLTEFLLRILLDRTDLTVKQSLTQKEKHNIFGRSVRLDILAVDTEGKQYNIEIQRADKGASKKRARYNLSMIDSHSLQKNDDFSALSETYIIFITVNDIYKKGDPIYKVKQIIETIDGTILPFDNGVNTIYVNGAYNGENAIGWLMHDFRESNADKMHYAEIAERVRFHKQENGEVNTVCRAFEEYGNEREEKAKREMAMKLIQKNKLSLEDIAETTDLPLEQVQKMAEQLKSN